MSEENVEMLRNSYAAFNRGDWEAALDNADPKIEWRLHGQLGIDAPQAIRGRETLKAFWADFFDIWDDYKIEPLDFNEATDGRVLATVRFTARGQGSSIPIELTYFWVHVVRSGAIVSVDLYTERVEALEAAGLSERAMSEENVEAVRIAYDVAYVQRSVEGIRDRIAEDFIWHNRPEWPGRRTYRGDEMTDLWADLDETFSEFELVPVAFEELGDHVVVEVRQSACLHGSDSQIDVTTWHLWRVEDGKPREAWAFGTRTEALEAAELSE
ncbi:MAG: nuclear transport factor 2 family protein [Solirubrobacterales bacterium]